VRGRGTEGRGRQAHPELLAAAREAPGDSSQRLGHVARLFERAAAQARPQPPALHADGACAGQEG
jgi:hypothetical protein